MERLITIIFTILLSLPCFAWEEKDNAIIKQFVQFETGISRDVMLVEFEDSSGASMWCHVDYGNQSTISLLLTLYVAEKNRGYIATMVRRTLEVIFLESSIA